MVDREGKIVVTPQYSEIADFAEGYAAVGLDGKFGFVDLDGRNVMVIPPQLYCLCTPPFFF